jgi:hypothetical protein
MKVIQYSKLVIQIILLLGIKTVYAQAQDPTMHQVNGVINDFVRYADYKLAKVYEEDSVYELMYKWDRTGINFGGKQIREFNIPTNLIHVKVDANNYQMLSKKYFLPDSLFKVLTITRSQMIDCRKSANEYQFFYICERKGKLKPGILELTLNTNFNIAATRFIEFEQAKYINVEKFASNESGFVFCEYERLNINAYDYRFVHVDPLFKSQKYFEVSVPTTYQLGTQKDYFFHFNEIGKLVIYANGSVAAYDMTTGAIVPMNTGKLELLQENDPVEKDIFRIKYMNENVWTSFIIHQSNSKVHGHDQLLVLNDSANSSVGIGKVSTFTFKFDTATCVGYYNENEIKKYKGNARHHVKGIPGAFIDTVIRKPDGNYFFIMKNVLVHRTYYHSMSLYQNTVSIREFGPVLIFHFTPDHQLLKMTTLEKMNYGIGAETKQNGTNWKLIGNMLYGCTGTEDQKGYVIEYVHKYNTLDQTYSSETFTVFHTNISIHLTDKGNLFLATDLYYDEKIKGYFPLAIQPLDK